MYAGADFYHAQPGGPCGLNQMYALRYGTTASGKKHRRVKKIP